MKTRRVPDVPKLFELWTAGKPSAQIAAELGVSTSAVYDAAKQYGLPRRTRQKPQRLIDPTLEEIAERAAAIKERNLAEMRAQP